LDASLDVSVDLGLTGRRRDEVATGLALMERDALDVDLFPSLPAKEPGPMRRTVFQPLSRAAGKLHTCRAAFTDPTRPLEANEQ
jgi:hypothetical protein